MGITRWFRRRRRLSADDVRRALFEALDQRDVDKVLALIDEHDETIRSAFVGWMTVPAAIRADVGQGQKYVEALSAVANIYDRSGRPELLAILLAEGTIFTAWERDAAKAERLVDSGRMSDAVIVLRRMLDEMSMMAGPGIDHYRPRILGRLGIALAKAGDVPAAIVVTRQALDLCREARDEEGIHAYTRNLRALGVEDVDAGPER